MTERSTPPGVVGLLGREEALSVLHRFVDAGTTIGGSLLLVGPPGVGKTALLDSVAAHVGDDVRVVRAAGIEFEADVSFAGLHQVLVPLIAELPALSDHHQAVLTAALGLTEGSPTGRLVVAAAALELLRCASTVHPLVIVIDDLAWLDRSSAQVLGFVARRLAGTRIALLAALRTGELSYFEQSGISVLEVGPLDDSAAVELVRRTFPTVSDGVCRRLVTESQGIALALLELPRELTHAQQSGVESLPTTMRLGRELQTIFAARVTTLSSETRQLLLLAALDGTGDLRILDQVNPAGAGDAFAAAERARLVSVDTHSHRLVFAHPLIRAAVVTLATAAEQRAAHRALAHLFDGDPDLRVQHLSEATTEPDEEVAAALEHAAYRVLGRGDPVGAVTALVRSAELSEVGKDRARRLTEAAWIGADVTGALGDVASLVTQARKADPSPDSPLATAVLAAFVLLNGDGDVDTAHRLLVAALHVTEPGEVAVHVLDEAVHTLMMVCFVGDRSSLWASFDSALQRFGSNLSPLQTVAATTFGDPQHCDPNILVRLDQIVASLHYETDPARIVRVAIAANFVGRMDGCRDALLRVVADGRSGGAVASAVTALLMLTDDDILAGRWDEARRLAEEGIALCDEHGYPLLAWPGRYALALIAAAKGENERSAGLTAEMLQWATPRGASIVATYSRHTAGVAALGRGDWQEAYASLASVNHPGVFGSREAYALWTMLDLVEAAVRSGHADEAAAHVAAAVLGDHAAISPRQAYLCAGAAAMIADDADAAHLFEQAAAMVGADRWPFERARLELAHGERLRRLHLVTAARVHLNTAVELFDQLGARPWAARARTELQATGQRRRSGSDDGAVLTPQERQIAQLAATGLTNREIGTRLFLSPRTVSAHLYRTFPKLEVTSRAGLRDALDRLDNDGGEIVATVI